jgi:hypothetical protein
LTPPLSLHAFIEQPQAFLRRQRLRWRAKLDPDRVSGRTKLDLVSGANAKPFGDRLGNRHLELARYPGHVLTLARTESLHKAAPRVG